MKTITVLFLGISLLSSFSLARYHRSGHLDSHDFDLRSGEKHAYYVLVNNEAESTAALCADFSKRLGEDAKVRLLPASKVKTIPSLFEFLEALMSVY